MALHELTISHILKQLADEYTSIVSERELCERVLQQRPSQAKDPYASIRDKLRWDGSHVGWVRLGGGEVIPLRVVREGLTFRLIPNDDEYHHDGIPRYRLLPFLSSHDIAVQLVDADNRPIVVPAAAPHDTEFVPASAILSLGDWFRRSGFEQGDSILVTIVSHEPLSLRLEREPAAAFNADDVLRQERELVDAVAKLVARSRSSLIPADEVILPLYARAEWRTAYPGRPWQMLIANDRRMRLVDELFIANSSFRRPLDLVLGSDEELRREDGDNQLLAEIASFQEELMNSRRDDAAQGLWDGRAPRASTARVIFDTQAGTSTVVYLEPVDSLQDQREQIEENLEQGSYSDESWSDDFDDDDDDFDGLDGYDSDEEMLGLDQIDDIQSFMEQNPALAEAAQKLMAALTPDEVDRLQRADTPEDAQYILAGRFHKMLPGDPSMFAVLAPYTVEIGDGNEPTNGHVGNGNGNGNGHSFGGLDHPELPSDLLEETWQEDEDEWEDLSAEHVPGDTAASREALARSNELMERFYQHLRAQGKSETTATSRTGDLWVYADFLANYYSRGLAEGDYATLDECMFFFYPRKVLNSTPRAAREMCTSIKQFYAFLRSHNTTNDGFAQAIWRRRDQAARVVELYEHIDSDSPQFERLFAHLFAPYTA